MLSVMTVMVIPVVIGALGTVPKGLVSRLTKAGNQGTNGDHPNFSIVKIGQNTKILETCGDLLSLSLLRKTIS